MAKSKPSKPTSKKSKPAPLEGNKVWKERGRVRRTTPSMREKSAWEKLPNWSQHTICLGFLLVVALGFFSATAFGGYSLAGSDTVQWRGTAEAMIQYEASSNGTDALWAPYVYGGMPGYMIHYGPKVPGLDTILQSLRARGMWPYAHFFILLCGMYLLVAYLTRMKLAGVLAAVAFGLTTYLPLILIAGHNTKFIALCYAPWMLFTFAAILYRPDDSTWMRNVLLGLLFALVAALNLRAAHIQVTYYVVFVAMVWWIAEGVMAIRMGKIKRFSLSTSVLVMGAVLALAMVAQPYLTQWEFKAFTIRSSGEGGGLPWENAMMWSQGVKEMFTLIIANAFGGGSGEMYWGAKPGTAGPHYLGAVVVALSVFGALGVARRATTGLGVAALLMTGFALGENFGLLNRPMFDLFPLFSSFRVPETWLIAVSLVISILAGYGVYYLARREATPEAEERKTKMAYLGFGISIAVVGMSFLGSGMFFNFEKGGEREQIQQLAAQEMSASPADPAVITAANRYLSGVKTERQDVFRSDALRGLGFLVLAALLIVLYRKKKIPAWAAVVGLIFLVTIDLWGVGRRYFNEESPSLRRNASVAEAIPEYDFDRYIQNEVEMSGGPGHFRTLPLALNAMNDGRSPYFYESTGGYNAAKLSLYQDYIEKLLYADPTLLNLNALDLMSTRYVIAEAPLPGLVPVYQSQETGLLVLENQDVLPRAFFVDELEVVEQEEALLARLRDTTLVLAETALVSTLPEGYSPATRDTSSVMSVDLNRFIPRELVWEVETDADRLLVVSEVYYPAGWKAFVNDQEAEIIQVNHLLRGVMVPAGGHNVSMRFDPESHTSGLRISMLATLLVYLGAFGLGGLLWFRKGHAAKG